MISEDVGSDECYFCERHKYVQLFYDRDRRDKQYQQVVDSSSVSLLKQNFKQAIERSRESKA